MKRGILLLTALLFGCASPTLPSPDGKQDDWRSTTSGKSVMQQATRVTGHFNDPVLSQLIQDVLSNNNDLAVAGFRLRQAWLAAGLADEARFPGISATTTVANSQQLKPKQSSTESWQSDTSLSWEIDLWGKLARQRDQSVWQAQASDYDRSATALSLIKTTAELYWTIALSNAQLENYDAQIAISQQQVNLVEQKYRAGEVSASDCYRAEQSVLQLALSRDALLAKRSRDRHALSILFDSSPRQQQPERVGLPDAGTVSGPEAIPLQALSNRPDVRKAEMQLRASLAGSDVARLNFYPTLSLSSALGSASSMFSLWFAHPSRTVSASVALPFLQWDKVMLTVENADLDVKAAQADFRTAIWKALADTEDAYSDSRHALNQYNMNNRNLELSQALWQQEKMRYAQGETSLQDALNAESAWLLAKNTLQSVNYDYLTSALRLWLTFNQEKTGTSVNRNNEGT
jgi:NodT family efflux transporter outer membrane factor (OMF) lipoprotein